MGIWYNYYGSDVEGGQYVLQDTGYSPGTIDGKYGPNTRNATIDYQSSNGLGVDGIVGTQTWGSFQSKLYWSGIDDTYGAYYNVGYDGIRFYDEYVLNGGWFVLDSGHVCDPYGGYYAMAFANCNPA